MIFEASLLACRFLRPLRPQPREYRPQLGLAELLFQLPPDPAALVSFIAGDIEQAVVLILDADFFSRRPVPVQQHQIAGHARRRQALLSLFLFLPVAAVLALALWADQPVPGWYCPAAA